MEHLKTKKIQKNHSSKKPKQRTKPNKSPKQTNQQANIKKQTMKATEPEYPTIQSINFQEEKRVQIDVFTTSSKKGSGIQK